MSWPGKHCRIYILNISIKLLCDDNHSSQNNYYCAYIVCCEYLVPDQMMEIDCASAGEEGHLKKTNRKLKLISKCKQKAGTDC